MWNLNQIFSGVFDPPGYIHIHNNQFKELPFYVIPQINDSVTGFGYQSECVSRVSIWGGYRLVYIHLKVARWAFPNVPLLCMEKRLLARGGQQEIELSESEFFSPKYYFWHWIIGSHLLGAKFRAGNNLTSIFNLPHVLGNCGTLIRHNSIGPLNYGHTWFS